MICLHVNPRMVQYGAGLVLMLLPVTAAEGWCAERSRPHSSCWIGAET